MKKNRGFTLLELAIVLTIIGLLAGGVLVGRSLITASQVRATIAQVQQYQSATNTFEEKFGALPGDLPQRIASQYGFTTRGSYAGEGDGNNLIEGITSNSSGENNGLAEQGGETVMYWVDLTSANGLNLNYVNGNFTAAQPAAVASGTTTGTLLNSWLPPAKIGGGNYFYVYSYQGVNYFGLSSVYKLATGYLYSTVSLTVLQAFYIDQKIDDALPQTGVVLASYVLGNTVIGASGLAVGTGGSSADSPGAVGTAATQGTPYTCYDNNNTAGAVQTYSLEINSGAGINCALSFVFQ